MQATGHRPEIDGLRALAIAPVVLYHAGFAAFTGGFVGVDIFFVISGYLITRIIHGELAQGRFSILRFYERRARRILPALAAALAGATLVALALMSATDLIEFSKSLAATALFASNLWFQRSGGGYFDPGSEAYPLLHTWSLAVEEQFYIVFPLLLMALHRLARSRIRTIVALLSAASLALAVRLVATDPHAAFYLAPARAWELGLGALLALGAAPRVPAGWRDSLGWAALAMIAAPVLLYTRDTPFPGLAAIPPCLGAALLIHLDGAGSSGRLLAWRPLGLLGLISYSLYLWHWPVIVLLEGMLGVAALPPIWGLAAVAVSLLLATLSWRHVEQPFRTPGRFSRTTIFALAGTSIAAVLAVAAGLWVARGLPGRLAPDESALIEARYDRNPRRAACMGRSVAEGLCAIGREGAEPSFLLWGDSHADSLQPGIELAAERAGERGLVASYEACAPLPGVRQETPGCDAAQRAVLDHLARRPGIGLVVLAARWPLWRTGTYVGDEPGPPHPIAASAPGQAGLGRPALFDAAARDTVRRLRAMGRRVLVIGSVPEIGWDVPVRLFAARRFGASPPLAPTRGQALARQAADGSFAALARDDPGVRYLDLLPHFCDARCRVTVGGKPLYVDEDHLSASGARTVIAPLVEPLLR